MPLNLIKLAFAEKEINNLGEHIRWIIENVPKTLLISVYNDEYKHQEPFIY